jgi:hypothetical protein
MHDRLLRRATAALSYKRDESPSARELRARYPRRESVRGAFVASWGRELCAMTSLTNKQITQITIGAVVGVWAAAIASAGMLAFALNRPLRLPGVAAFEPIRTVEVADVTEAIIEPLTDEAVGAIGEVWVYGKPAESTATGAPATDTAIDSN